MATAARDLSGPDYAGLIQPDRVHGSLYTDPGRLRRRAGQIWYRTWVFVGHESEVAEPGDYVRKTLGPAGRHHDPRPPTARSTCC